MWWVSSPKQLLEVKGVHIHVKDADFKGEIGSNVRLYIDRYSPQRPLGSKTTHAFHRILLVVPASVFEGENSMG